ncbi:MAG TPA: UxaA family hydrolase, partial [Acidimicrobiales bacterium]|nr:UxaA family hydrolase [Acidimicrobiales bacterium]
MATTTSAPIDGRLLLLDPEDDCAVARVPIPAGTLVQIAGEQVLVGIDLGVGHKIAVRNLAPGDRVRKSGAVVGRTTAAVATGEHLHLHNLRSDYMPAHLVGGQSVGTTATAPEPSGRPPAGPSAPAAAHAPARGAHAAPRSDATRAPRLPELSGYLRADGRKGIRNHILVVYTVECAHHVTRRIADAFDSTGQGGVQVVGFPGCYPNEYAQRVLSALCTHPNVGGALVVSLGCESFDARALVDAVRESGRWVDRLVIQEDGGTSATIARGRALVAD